MAVQEIRSGSADQDGDGNAGTRPHGSAAPLAVPGAQARLNRILGRETWHQTGGGWISGAIYGANDGLAAVFGIVAAAAGGGDPKQAALAAGVSPGLGAIVPVIPFMITTGTAAIIAAAVVSLVAHFLVGAAKTWSRCGPGGRRGAR